MKLNNGINIPQIGIGTFLLTPDEAYNSVLNALKMGYRLIDTANVYVNEKAVGRAIKDSQIKREDIFISTKLWATEYENPHAVEDTLKRLGVGYIDLLFVHQPTRNWREGYKQIVKAYQEGKVRSIGISNFEGEYLDDLLKVFDVLPEVIQVECHPFFPQVELRKVTEPVNIKIMSWYPLGGKGRTEELLKNEIIQELSVKYHKSPAQIVLRWHIQMGFIVIPGSRNKDHIFDNFNIFDFSLTNEDMKLIEKLSCVGRRYIRSQERLDQFQIYAPQYEK